MSTFLRLTTILLFPVLLLGKTYAQDTTTTDFFDRVKNYDLSKVLTADSFLDEESKDKIERTEILGFIGDDFQRFYIHFVSIIQNPTNPYEYLVYGKSKVKETICSFQGTIAIRQAKLYTSVDIPTYKQGFAICDVVLYEDKKQTSTGFFKGQLKSEFLIDDKKQFRYDAISFMADGYSNNQFIGNWTSYKTTASKKCHWGDYRIPQCGDLDIGAGEFSANDNYLKNGWTNYRLAWATYPETTEVKQAREKEKEEWWR